MNCAFLVSLLLAQERGLNAAASRRVFGELTDLVISEGNLVVRRGCADMRVRRILENLDDELGLQFNGSSYSGGTDIVSRSLEASDGRDPDLRLRTVFSLKADRIYIEMALRHEMSIQVIQEEPGTLRFFYERGPALVRLQQTVQRCRLVYADDSAAHMLTATSFEELMRKHPFEVSRHVLAPLEEWIDAAPLSIASPAVVEMAAGAADFHWLARRMETIADPEAKLRVEKSLKADPRREAAYRLVADHHLYRDLDYLTRALAAGIPTQAHLERITRVSHPTPTRWAEWVKENAGRLVWDEEAFLWKRPTR